MYKVRVLVYDHFKKEINLKKGVDCKRESGNDLNKEGFWGKLSVTLKKHADVSVFEKGFFGRSRVTYLNTYNVSNMRDKKNIKFVVDEHEPDNVEGYLIFTKKNVYSVETDGEILFEFFSRNVRNEAVVVLRDGQYLKYDGGIAKVENGKLVLS